MFQNSKIHQIKDLILYSAILDFKLKYKGTTLGFLWSILEPLIQLAILAAVFSFLHTTDSTFILYLFSGLIMVHFFNRSTQNGLNSILSKKSILISVNIPKIIFPLSTVLTNFFTFVIEITIFFVMIIVFSHEVTIHAFILFVAYIFTIVFSTGISLILSVIRSYYKDIQSIWNIVTMAMIFVTPIFWYVHEMPQSISQIFLLNPLATLMEISHKAILFHEYPSLFEYTYGISSSIGIFLLGYFLFKKTEKKLVENL